MNSAIIVAAGEGLRMGAPIPKQFIKIHGKTILEYTLNQFVQSDLIGEYIIVLSKDYLNIGKDLQEKYARLELKICQGGKQRFDSVKNALKELNEKSENVFIHDAVRPFFTTELMLRCLSSCEEKGSGIPATNIKDSLRIIKDSIVDGKKIQDGRSNAINRDLYRSVQTPQVFQTNKLVEAYNDPFSDKIVHTDDASVYEEFGYQVYLVEGDSLNIKITTPEDLDIAKIRLSAANA